MGRHSDAVSKFTRFDDVSRSDSRILIKFDMRAQRWRVFPWQTSFVASEEQRRPPQKSLAPNLVGGLRQDLQERARTSLLNSKKSGELLHLVSTVPAVEAQGLQCR